MKPSLTLACLLSVGLPLGQIPPTALVTIT